MPVSFAFDRDAMVAVVTLEGDLDDEAVLAGFRALAADPRMDPSYNLLVDARPMEAGPVSSSGIRSIAGLRSPVSPASRRAVLVSTDFGYGMSRMFNLNIPDEKLAFTIFRDENEAREYVGLPPVG